MITSFFLPVVRKVTESPFSRKRHTDNRLIIRRLYFYCISITHNPQNVNQLYKTFKIPSNLSRYGSFMPHISGMPSCGIPSCGMKIAPDAAAPGAVLVMMSGII